MREERGRSLERDGKTPGLSLSRKKEEAESGKEKRVLDLDDLDLLASSFLSLSSFSLYFLSSSLPPVSAERSAALLSLKTISKAVPERLFQNETLVLNSTDKEEANKIKTIKPFWKGKNQLLCSLSLISLSLSFSSLSLSRLSL